LVAEEDDAPCERLPVPQPGVGHVRVLRHSVVGDDDAVLVGVVVVEDAVEVDHRQASPNSSAQDSAYFSARRLRVVSSSSAARFGSVLSMRSAVLTTRATAWVRMAAK